ncbi:MAG: hypothetical protein J6S85_05820 [Methanobrevibacter sp.]|nr:hypothetical protein [Methanobrevibacter sp.]
MNTIVISYNKDMKYITVFGTEDEAINSFYYDEDFNIIEEQPDTDCEDFNDNARWLVKTLLQIIKMETKDDLAHCDWSADYEKMPETGKYMFNVELKKVK